MQKIQVILFISIMPIILMGMYINDKDLDKEPRKLIARIFIYGILSIVPILVLETLANKYVSTDNFTNYVSLFINN